MTNCLGLTNHVLRYLSTLYEDKLQDALNKANRELLAALKNGSNENATEKRNTTNEMSPSLIDSLSNYTFQSDDGDNTEPIPYAED